MSSLHFKGISDLKVMLENKEISILEIKQEFQSLYAKYDKKINSIIEFFDDVVLPNQTEHMLSGIPFFTKDVICQKNRLTCAGSNILSGHIAAYDATVIKNLNNVGAFSLGRANCDEFAMGASGETSFYGITRNPWDLERVPGGSSSGSAAAVAAGLIPFALGSETGGSIRQPSSYCNLVGLKTTYGLNSRFGLLAYASSLDQIGIFSRSVIDCAMALSGIAGKDPFDSTSACDFDKKNYLVGIDAPLKGKKIAILKNAFEVNGMNPKTQTLLSDALRVFMELGVEVKEVTLPTMDYSGALYFIISRAEAASNFSRYDGVKYGYRVNTDGTLQEMYKNTRYEGFGKTVQQRIVLGNFVLSSEYADAYYNKAKMIQAEMKKEFFEALSDCDVIFSPVCSEPAFKIGDMDKDPLAMDLLDYFTACANLVGIPALSLPAGFVDGLPMGFQLMANKFDEEMLFNFGYHYQKKTDWHTKQATDFSKEN